MSLRTKPVSVEGECDKCGKGGCTVMVSFGEPIDFKYNCLGGECLKSIPQCSNSTYCADCRKVIATGNNVRVGVSIGGAFRCEDCNMEKFRKMGLIK